MKPGMYALLAILLSGCSVEPYTHAPTWTGTDWYSAGKDDALSGAVVKENKVLAAVHNDADVDRNRYLQGYKAGLKRICHDDFLYAWGRAGKIYPAGCDTQESAAQLRSAWQAGMDEGTRDAVLN
ncbi:DUF2799 domain-containing protein [Enterobacter sp. C2]|uniref:DUF2799 domain-containing protein n=1 Tax=Enterobacter sp. C2 TaxID=2870346 RepID=UPI001CA4265C|nr:DUF2799 domain-containing protein [Enterobacter sp. C2]